MNTKLARIVLLGAALMTLLVFIVGCGNSSTDSNAGQNVVAPPRAGLKPHSKNNQSSFTSPD